MSREETFLALLAVMGAIKCNIFILSGAHGACGDSGDPSSIRSIGVLPLHRLDHRVVEVDHQVTIYLVLVRGLALINSSLGSSCLCSPLIGGDPIVLWELIDSLRLLNSLIINRIIPGLTLSWAHKVIADHLPPIFDLFGMNRRRHIQFMFLPSRHNNRIW